MGLREMAQPHNYENTIFLQGKNKRFRAGFCCKTGNFYNFEIAKSDFYREKAPQPSQHVV